MINIDKEKCVACGACVRVCLQHVEQIKRALGIAGRKYCTFSLKYHTSAKRY